MIPRYVLQRSARLQVAHADLAHQGSKDVRPGYAVDPCTGYEAIKRNLTGTGSGPVWSDATFAVAHVLGPTST